MKVGAVRERRREAGPRPSRVRPGLGPHFTGREGEARGWRRAPEGAVPAAAPGSRPRRGGGGARALPLAPRSAAGAGRRAGRKAEGGAAAPDGHLKWPLRVEGSFPREGGLRAAQEVGVCARRPQLRREVGSPGVGGNFLLDGPGEAWSRTTEPLKAQACGHGGWCQGTWPGGRKSPARPERGCQGRYAGT